MKSYGKKLMMPAILAAAVCFACTGCGKMTEEKLMDNVAKAMTGRTFMGGDIDMNMDLSYAMDIMEAPVSADMSMQANGRSLSSYDPFGVYSDMNMQMDFRLDMDGEVQEMSMGDQIQTYTAQEDDTLALYTYSNTSSQWSRIEMEQPASNVNALSDLMTVPEDQQENISLEDEPFSLNGVNTYVLKMDRISIGQESVAILETMFPQIAGSISSDSLGDVTMSATFYIDQETFLPLQMEYSFDNFGELFNQNPDLWEGVLGSAMDETGTANITVDVPSYRLTMTNLTFEQEELPIVPEEAYESIAFQEALAELDPDLGDGTYAIQSSGSAVRVSTPDGMTAVNVSADTVTFADDSGLNTITYAMVPSVDLELYTDSISSMYTGALEMLGAEVRSGQDSQNVSTPFGPVDGYWISGGGANVYYGFAPFEGAYLAVICNDFSGTEPDSAAALGEAFGYAAELTPADIL